MYPLLGFLLVDLWPAAVAAAGLFRFGRVRPVTSTVVSDERKLFGWGNGLYLVVVVEWYDQVS